MDPKRPDDLDSDRSSTVIDQSPKVIDAQSPSPKSKPKSPSIALIGLSSDLGAQMEAAFEFEFNLIAASFDSPQTLRNSASSSLNNLSFACVCGDLADLDFLKAPLLEFAVICKRYNNSTITAWIERGATAVYCLEHHSPSEVAKLVVAHGRVAAQRNAHSQESPGKHYSGENSATRNIDSDADIPPRISTEEELQFAKHTVENSSSGILFANTRGRIVYHNEAVNRILGYTSEELGEFSISEIDPHLVPPTHLNKKAQYPLSGPWEKVYRNKYGKNIDVEVDCKFIDADDDTVLAVYIRDISRRKRIEREVTELNKRLEERVEERTQQLAESNEKLRNEMRERLVAEQHASQQRAFLAHVVDKLPLGIYVAEAEKDYQISVWNAEMERLFGSSKATVVGKRIDEIFTDSHLAKVLGDQSKQDVHSRTITLPSGNRQSSIQSFVADIARTPIFDTKGNKVALVGVVQDVSERINSENRLVAAFRELELSKSQLERSNLEIRQGIEKAKKLAIAAQDSNRAKSFFMSNISHELRTPLNSILGLTSVLLERTFGDLTSKQSEFLRIIDDSSRHLQSLITDILDLSKIELGKLKLQYSPISPKELGDTTLKMVKQAEDQKPLDYQLKCPSQLPEIEADPRRLRQILLNLLDNAAKFAAENTTITLAIDVTPDGERITFSIKDRGIGIRSEDLRKLFQPFVQIDDSLSRSHEGTGLGLAIVHKLVELHGGSVHVESEPQKGSVFSFSIPTLRTLQNADNQLKLSDVYDASPRKQVALIIDENEASAQHACRILKKNGYAHPVVTYPNEVSAHYAHLHPHLIVVDIQTLRNQGSDWIAAARNHPNWKKTTWLATSSLNTQPDLSYCDQLELHIFTPKPLTPNNLRILNP